MSLVRSYPGTDIAVALSAIIALADGANDDRVGTAQSSDGGDSDPDGVASREPPHSAGPKAGVGVEGQPLLLAVLADVVRVWGDATATESAPHEVSALIHTTTCHVKAAAQCDVLL
jgi:hypothetical protein